MASLAPSISLQTNQASPAELMHMFFRNIMDGEYEEWENRSPNGVYEAKYAAVVDWRYNNTIIKLDGIGALLAQFNMAHLAVRDGIHDGIFKSMIKYLKSLDPKMSAANVKEIVNTYLIGTLAKKQRELASKRIKYTASDGKKTIDSLLFKRVVVDAHGNELQDQEPPELSQTMVIGNPPQYKIFTNHYDIFPELRKGENLFISAFTIHHFFDTLYEIQNDIAETRTKRKNRIKNLISDLLNAIDDISMPLRRELVDQINMLFRPPCITLDDNDETEIIDDSPFDIDTYVEPAQTPYIITWPIPVSPGNVNLWLAYMGPLINKISGYNGWHTQLPSYTSLSISRKLRREIMMNGFKHLMKERLVRTTSQSQQPPAVYCVVDNGSANAQIDPQYKELKVHGIIFDMVGAGIPYTPHVPLTNMRDIGMTLEQWRSSGFTISFKIGDLGYSMFVYGGHNFDSVSMVICLKNYTSDKMLIRDVDTVSANKNAVLSSKSLLIGLLVDMMKQLGYDMKKLENWVYVLQFAGLTKHAGDIGQALSILAIQQLFPHLTLCASTHDSWLTLFYKMCERLGRPIRFMRTKLSSITEELKTFFTIDVNVEDPEQPEIVLYDNASVWASRWGIVEGEIQKVLSEANYENYYKILGYLGEFIKFLKKTGYRFPQQTIVIGQRGLIKNLSHFFLVSQIKIVAEHPSENKVDYNNITLLWQTFNGFIRSEGPLLSYNVGRRQGARPSPVEIFKSDVRTMLDLITKEINEEVRDILQSSDDGGASSAGGDGGSKHENNTSTSVHSINDTSMGGMSLGGGKKKKRKKKTRRKKKHMKKKQKKKTRRNKKHMKKKQQKKTRIKKRKTRSNKKQKKK